MLTRFLQRNRCSAAEIANLRQEAHARIYEVAHQERAVLVKPFLFRIARNLMIDRFRKQSVIVIMLRVEVPEVSRKA
jgi:DNA-directed RNA polymerase specialized sigma24 family protein